MRSKKRNRRLAVVKDVVVVVEEGAVVVGSGIAVVDAVDVEVVVGDVEGMVVVDVTREAAVVVEEGAEEEEEDAVAAVKTTRPNSVHQHHRQRRGAKSCVRTQINGILMSIIESYCLLRILVLVDLAGESFFRACCLVLLIEFIFTID